MKVIDAINEANNLKPNMYSTEDKIKWLSRLDMRIFLEIILTHERKEGEPEIDFNGYTENDGDEEMLVGEPYDEIYVHWLAAQIDYYNKEFEAFNNSNAMFESTFAAFRNAYNSTHRPKGASKNYF